MEVMWRLCRTSSWRAVWNRIEIQGFDDAINRGVIGSEANIKAWQFRSVMQVPGTSLFCMPMVYLNYM